MVDPVTYACPIQVRGEDLQVALAHVCSRQPVERWALRARKRVDRNDLDAVACSTRENDARASMMASDLDHATPGRQGSRTLVQEPSLLHRQPAFDSLDRRDRILEAPATQLTACLRLEIHASPDTTARYRRWESQAVAARCRS